MEMLVVLGILGMLMGVAFSGIGKAQKRARVAKATAEVRELANAIRAYEAAEDNSAQFLAEGVYEATTGDPFFLRLVEGGDGKPVYLNVPLTSDGRFLDPWGRPYRFRIGIQNEGDTETFRATVTFPNRQRNLR
jgi:type II secretory pathway pseudopilin PulG